MTDNRIPWPTHKTKARHARSTRLHAARKARRARRGKTTALLDHTKVGAP